LAALEDRLKDELAAHDEAAKKEYERDRLRDLVGDAPEPS
jgi:hypothetical protein